MTKTKQTKAQRIAELERKLQESEASQIHHYHFATAELPKAGIDRLNGSGVILTLTVLGGRKICDPVLIRNGLSAETISALKADMVRSFEYATELKPKA